MTANQVLLKADTPRGRGTMGWGGKQPQKLELHSCRSGYALQTSFLRHQREMWKEWCGREAVGIQGNKDRLSKKICCQNQKQVCCHLQLEDSEGRELLFLLIRPSSLLSFLFESQISACTLSAHGQCLHATEKLHHAVFSLHRAGIFRVIYYSHHSLLQWFQKDLRRALFSCQEKEGSMIPYMRISRNQKAKQCLLPVQKPCDLEQHCPRKDTTQNSEPDPDKSFEI